MQSLEDIFPKVWLRENEDEGDLSVFQFERPVPEALCAALSALRTRAQQRSFADEVQYATALEALLPLDLCTARKKALGTVVGRAAKKRLTCAHESFVGEYGAVCLVIARPGRALASTAADVLLHAGAALQGCASVDQRLAAAGIEGGVAYLQLLGRVCRAHHRLEQLGAPIALVGEAIAIADAFNVLVVRALRLHLGALAEFCEKQRDHAMFLPAYTMSGAITGRTNADLVARANLLLAALSISPGPNVAQTDFAALRLLAFRENGLNLDSAATKPTKQDAQTLVRARAIALGNAPLLYTEEEDQVTPGFLGWAAKREAFLRAHPLDTIRAAAAPGEEPLAWDTIERAIFAFGAAVGRGDTEAAAAAKARLQRAGYKQRDLEVWAEMEVARVAAAVVPVVAPEEEEKPRVGRVIGALFDRVKAAVARPALPEFETWLLARGEDKDCVLPATFNVDAWVPAYAKQRVHVAGWLMYDTRETWEARGLSVSVLAAWGLDADAVYDEVAELLARQGTQGGH